MNTPASELALHIEGMDCADCALTLERAVGRLEGVAHVEVSFTLGTLQAAGQLDRQAIVGRVQALGYQVRENALSEPEPSRHSGIAGFVRYLWADRATALALIGLGLLLLTIPLSLLPTSPALEWSIRGLHVAVVALSGYRIALGGLRALFLARQVTIDLLMTIAAVGAVLIGETAEAATVTILFAIGEALEAYTADRARDAVRSLFALQPERATVLRPCIDCAHHMGQDGYAGGLCPFCGTHEAVIPVEQVQVGETVLLRPGERVPVDGRVLSGTSSVDQAPVTGESVPVIRSEGDEVYAGAINGEAALEIEVTRPAADSTISRIARLVETAQSLRSPMERFIDRFARWYTPAVVALALLLATVPPLAFSAPFLDAADGTRGWLYRALALLIVACPCALVISTPVTVVSAMTSLARRGVLVKGGAFLEALTRVKVFALDKTGTLTQGQPRVIATRTRDCASASASCERCPEPCLACDDMLALASSVERRSEHPLARAILSEARHRSLLSRYPAAEGVQALAGKGVEGTLGDRRIMIGNHSLFHARDADCALHEYIVSREAEGQTVMLVAQDDRLIGYVAVADVPRETSRSALREIKRIAPDTHIVMLTGDTPPVAHAIAAQVEAIDEVRAGLLPEDKLAATQELRREHGPVAMIGDGVNDAPALAAADVGIAMGGAGTAQAVETADVVLMQDNLTRLPDGLQTSRRAHRVIWQNIALSLAVKAVVLVLALAGHAALWMAVAADMGTSLLVTLNGMRLLRVREATQNSQGAAVP